MKCEIWKLRNIVKYDNRHVSFQKILECILQKVHTVVSFLGNTSAIKKYKKGARSLEYDLILNCSLPCSINLSILTLKDNVAFVMLYIHSVKQSLIIIAFSDTIRSYS